MISRRALMAAFALAPVSLHAGELTAHDFAFRSIDDGMIRLADFAGRPMLVVNTASRCGFTYQYDQLQALYDRYREQGLVVIGVPSDDFNQELSSEAKVKEFCEVNFSIDFPMTAITPVRGTSAHPFYAWAANDMGRQNAPRWNFHKYLVDGEGRLIGAWGSGTEPTAGAIVEPIEAMLSQS